MTLSLNIVGVYFLGVLTLCFFGILLDYRRYRNLKNEYIKHFGAHIGKTYTVTKQNMERGSVLENGLSLEEVYIERGIVFFGHQMGDQVTIEPFPPYRVFRPPRVNI